MNYIAKILVVAVLGLVAFAGVSPASAKGPRGPAGWQILCIQQPQQCVGGGASRIAGGDETMQMLKRINSSVNRSIRPRLDGKLDIWTVNANVGDCEDYALTKRARLIAAGIPASALRIAQVKTRKGEGHAILVVETDTGRFVLDNLTGAIKPLSQTRYRVISMQTANPRVWA